MAQVSVNRHLGATPNNIQNVFLFAKAVIRVANRNYSRVSRRQKTLQIAIEVVPTMTGLRLLVDGTCIKMRGEGEWKTKKHGADYHSQWRKVHLGIGFSFGAGFQRGNDLTSHIGSFLSCGRIAG